MPDKEIHAEIESLKSQLSELQKAREEVDPQPTAKTENKPATDASGKMENDAETLSDEDMTLAHDAMQSEDLLTQVQELINALDEDIKQTKPATLLVIFALGVLLGRMLPR